MVYRIKAHRPASNVTVVVDGTDVDARTQAEWLEANGYVLVESNVPGMEEPEKELPYER